jgi:hypothetical protein
MQNLYLPRVRWLGLDRKAKGLGQELVHCWALAGLVAAAASFHQLQKGQ